MSKTNTRQNDYRFESARLMSYKNWPCAYIKPEKLATAGFFYVGKADIVKCIQCKVEIHAWGLNDDPILEHKKYSRSCSFVYYYLYDSTKLRDPWEIGCDDCGPYVMTSQQSKEKVLEGQNAKISANSKPNLSISGPKYPKYINYNDRLCTFKTWPETSQQSKEKLVYAGFFYTGNNDETVCYYCGGSLKEWKLEDNPWKQHSKWFASCLYLHIINEANYYRGQENLIDK